MKYIAEGDSVTLELTREDYARLIVILGFAAGGAAFKREMKTFWSIINFTNELNATNPTYQPYDIPDEMKEKC